MTYITENPVPGILVFACLAIVLWISGSQVGKKVSLICVLCAVGLFILEQSLISPAEEVEKTVASLLTEFQNEDLDAIEEFILDKDPELVDYARKGLKLVDLSPNFSIKSVVTKPSEDGRTMTAYVRANGRITISAGGNSGTRHAPTYWKTVWVQTDSGWKLKNVTRLRSTTGEEMEMFGQSY